MVFFALTVVSPTHADESNAVAAESLFNEARTLLDKGRFEEACERFSRSEQLDPAVGTLLNLGECYERLNKIASAWGAYRQAAALAVTRNDERRATLARRAAAKIEGRLAKLTITVDGGASSSVAITRNGVRVDPAAIDTTLPVDPGPQVIAATAPDHQPWQTTLELAAGESRTVHVPELRPNPAPTAAPAAATERPAPPRDVAPRAPAQTKIAVGLEIGGAVVLVGGFVLGGLALSTWSTVLESCPDATCRNSADRDRLASDVSTAHTLATLSTVSVAAGTIALTSGVVLHLTAPKHRIAVSPAVDASGAGFVARLQL
jgi:serine/threonine-protein kinase